MTDESLPPATYPNGRSRPRINRSTDRRLIIRCVLASILVAISGFCAIGVAVAQETPVLVAKALPDIENWCGDHAVTFRSRTKNREDVYWLDVLTGKKAKLQYGLSTLLLECSPDSRWVLTENDVGTVPSDDPNFREGGSPDCNEHDDGHLTRVVLWDMARGTHQVVGTGYMDFRRSPGGKLLLYRFRPFCNLESQPRNAFKLPSAVTEFQAISDRAIIAKLLGPNSGWPGKGRIGIMSWYASNAFVTQLPDGEGWWMDDSTPGGAIVAVHDISGSDAKIEQLNPSKFKSTFKFAVPQLPPAASDEILKAASCSVLSSDQEPGVLSCHGSEEIGLPPFKIDLAKYCQTLRAGDVRQFCAPKPPIYSWSRKVRGSTVLLLKRIGDERNAVVDLFRMENDHEGYLK